MGNPGSNGSPKMLAAAVESAGLADSLDAVLSVEEVGVFKPHPDVYRLGVDRVGLPAAEMAFHSANAWDAAAPAHFGYRAVWINRFGPAARTHAGDPGGRARLAGRRGRPPWHTLACRARGTRATASGATASSAPRTGWRSIFATTETRAVRPPRSCAFPGSPDRDRVPRSGVRALRSTRLPAGRAGTFRLPRWAA